MQSFFYICEYLGVTPQEFFDEGNPNPAALKEFITEAKAGFQNNVLHPRHYEELNSKKVEVVSHIKGRLATFYLSKE